MAGQFELGSKHQECIKLAIENTEQSKAPCSKEMAKNLLAKTYGYLPSESQSYNDYLGFMVALEEIAKVNATAASIIGEQLIAREIFATLSDKNLSEFVAEGETVGILCSEPGFSYICEISTKATKEENSWKLEGTKLISDEQVSSDKFIVFAKDEELNVRAFILPKSSITIVESEKIMSSTSVTIANVEINATVDEKDCIAVIDEKYERIQSIARTAIAAVSTGIAQVSLETGVTTAKQTKKADGEAISTSQSLQFTLADMFSEVEAGRMLTYQSADNIDKGNAGIKAATIAKVMASNAASKVTMDALQIIGNAGFLANAEFAPLVQRAVGAQVKGGTNRSQMSQIYKYMLAKK